MAKNNAIKSFIKGISGAAITGTAEMIKKIGTMDKNAKNRKQIPMRNRVGLNDKTKGTKTYENGGKQK